MCSPGKAQLPSQPRVTARVLRIVLASTLGGSFQFGFSTGFVNNSEVFIRDHFISHGLSSGARFDEEWSLAVGAFAVGGLLGTLVFPDLADRYGRKLAVMATTAFCYMSCYMIAFPAGWWALILGRALIGVGAGGACAVVPTYIAEVAPIHARGGLGTVHQLMITVGILVAQMLSARKLNLLGSDALWQYSLLVPCACATVLLLALPGCEDSPLHLLRTVGEKRAEASLRWLRGDKVPDYAVRQELMGLQLELSCSGAEQNLGLREVLKKRRLLGPVLVGTGVNLSMQLSGIDAVFYYSTKVLEDAGVSLEWAQVCTVLIAAVNVLVTVPAMLLMDTAGRKVIQTVGLGGMCLSYVVMTGALVLSLHRLAVLAMFLVVSFFAFGPGCIAWFIVAELTPVSARGLATTVGLGANWLANFLVAFIFPHVLVRLHEATFGIFAVSCFLLTAFTVLCLPETKGKTAAELSLHFAPSTTLIVPCTPSPAARLKRQDSTLSDISTAGSEFHFALDLPAPPRTEASGKSLSTSSSSSFSTLGDKLPASRSDADLRTPLLVA